MTRQAILPLLAALATRASGIVVSNAAGSVAAARSAEWRSCLVAEGEDQRFWSTEWSALEGDLEQLRSLAAPIPTEKSAKARQRAFVC